MWSAVVVEIHGQGHGSDDFTGASEDLALEQLVLHRVVYALGLGIILRIAGLRHADTDSILAEHVDILSARILAATVRVVYESRVLAFYASERHPQGFHRILRVECLSDAPSDNLLAVCIQDH